MIEADMVDGYGIIPNLYGRINAKKGPFVIDKAFQIQTINNLHNRFERFMEPFRGPANQQPYWLRLVVHRALGSRSVGARRGHMGLPDALYDNQHDFHT